jgi:hypothetical protein
MTDRIDVENLKIQPTWMTGYIVCLSLADLYISVHVCYIGMIVVMFVKLSNHVY